MRDEKADVAVFGYVGAGRLAGAIQTLFDWNDENGRATELQARFASIEVRTLISYAPFHQENSR